MMSELRRDFYGSFLHPSGKHYGIWADLLVYNHVSKPGGPFAIANVETHLVNGRLPKTERDRILAKAKELKATSVKFWHPKGRWVIVE